MTNPDIPSKYKVSVVVLNYNGFQWLERCFTSLKNQTIASEIEVIMTDNGSKDGSAEYAAQWLAQHQIGKVVQNNANLWYCEANNNGAAVASGEYLLFLNNDTWLEPTCLECLYNECRRLGADAATPLVLNYDDDSFQNIGAAGLDPFGLPTQQKRVSDSTTIFAACGCSYFVSAKMFSTVGGFDPKLLIYADETDISWKVWIAGGTIIAVPTARLHHRGAAVVNPAGNTKAVELRTSETKRFLANRNGLLFLLKNGQHILLLLLLPHLLLLLAEMLVSLILIKRWSYVRRSFIDAIWDCVRLRSHIAMWRCRISSFRKRGDFQLIRFLRLRPSRLAELQLLFKGGIPKVDAR